jgi:hypothetical protein
VSKKVDKTNRILTDQFDRQFVSLPSLPSHEITFYAHYYQVNKDLKKKKKRSAAEKRSKKNRVVIGTSQITTVKMKIAPGTTPFSLLSLC